MKGQLMSQPFIYMFYMLVAILVLFFGARIIKDVVDLGSEVNIKDFVIKIREKVNNVYYDNSGSITTLQDITVPTEIREVCILEMDNSPNLDLVSDNEFREILKLKEPTAKENLFVYGEDIQGKVEGYVVENLIPRIGENPTCSVVKNREVNMRLRNVGNLVEVVLVQV